MAQYPWYIYPDTPLGGSSGAIGSDYYRNNYGIPRTVSQTPAISEGQFYGGDPNQMTQDILNQYPMDSGDVTPSDWNPATFSDNLAFADRVSGLGSLLGWGGKGLSALGYASPMLASTLPSGFGSAMAGGSLLATALGNMMANHYISEQNKLVSDMFKYGFPDDWSIYNYSPYADYTQPAPSRPTPTINTPIGEMDLAQYYRGWNPYGTYGGMGETTYDGYNHDASDIGLGGYVGPVNMGALHDAGGLGGGDMGYGGGWGGPSGDWTGDAWGDSYY